MKKKTTAHRLNLRKISKFRKSEVSIDQVVIMVALLIGFLVLLVVTGTFGKFFSTLTGKSTCQMEFLISSFTKTGGAQTVDPNCEPHLITIKAEDLTKNGKSIENNLKVFNNNYVVGKNNPSAQQYVSQFTGNTKEWAMDQTVANEMKYCWDITGRGKLDLFSNWGNLVKCNKGTPQNPIPCGNDDIKGFNWESAKNLASNAGSYIWIPNWDINKPPTFCVLCSRIKFDDNIKASFSNPEITSMGMWLANNPVTDTGIYSKVPYATYLQNDAFKGLWASNTSYKYSIDNSYAVLYERVNVQQSIIWLSKFGVWTGAIDKAPEAVQIIGLVPYQNIKSECTYLVG